MSRLLQSNAVYTKLTIFLRATREKNYIMKLSKNENPAYLEVLF